MSHTSPCFTIAQQLPRYLCQSYRLYHSCLKISQTSRNWVLSFFHWGCKFQQAIITQLINLWTSRTGVGRLPRSFGLQWLALMTPMLPLFRCAALCHVALLFSLLEGYGVFRFLWLLPWPWDLLWQLEHGRNDSANSASLSREALQVSSCFPDPLPLPWEKTCLGRPAHQWALADVWGGATSGEPTLG